MGYKIHENGPPEFDSVPEGTEWQCFARPGRPDLWIPRMDPLPADVTEYLLDLIEEDLNYEEAKILGRN